MAGPRMGPRPADFNEEEVKKAPTWRKWMDTPTGEKLRYACRDFVKGNGVDEERLMRRIMIARRNNLKDHEALKRARDLAAKQKKTEEAAAKSSSGEAKMKEDQSDTMAQNKSKQQQHRSTPKRAPTAGESAAKAKEAALALQKKQEKQAAVLTDAQILDEMDVAAVESTRSYQAWKELEDGAEFLYNQKFIKGKEGQDWLLRKNIWRRMRYRRQNKQMMDEVLKDDHKPQRKRRAVKPRTDARLAPKTKKPRTTRGRKKYEPASHENMNQQMVNSGNNGVSTASQIVDQALMSTPAGVIAALQHQANMQQREQAQHQHASLESAAAEAAASISQDPDTAAVVEAAVAAGESYAIAPYVHNPLETNVDGMNLALDAAARLAAAKASSMETDAAALAAAVAEHHHPPVLAQQQANNTQTDQDDDVLDYQWHDAVEGESV